MKFPLLLVFFSLCVLSSFSQGISTPQLIKDIDSSPVDYAGQFPIVPGFVAIGNYMVFPNKKHDVTTLWVTDGTKAGTYEMDPNSKTSLLDSWVAANLNGKVIYMTYDGGGLQLKLHDPVTKQSTIVKQFSSSLDVVRVIRSGNVFMFAASGDIGFDLWRSDGTESGTFIVKNIASAWRMGRADDDGNTYSYFSSVGLGDMSNTISLWRTDGTGAGTIAVMKDVPIFTQETELLVAGNDAFFGFVAYSSPFGQFWKSNGTVAGTTRVIDEIGPDYPGSYSAAKVGSRVYFTLGSTIYSFDGATGGDVSQVITATVLCATGFNDKYYFIGQNIDGNYYLGITDDVTHSLGTYVMGPDPIYANSQISHFGDKLFITTMNGGLGAEPALFEDLEEEVVMIKDINAGAGGSRISKPVPFGDKMLFLADDGFHGQELWVTDGTEPGTFLLLDSQPGTGDAITPGSAIAKGPGNQYFFTVRDGNGMAIWMTDKTTANTKKVFSDGGDAELLGSINGKPYFSRKKGLVIFDASGTAQTFGSATLTASSLCKDGIEINGKLFFKGTAVPSSTELWVTEGTNSNTHLVKDIGPATANGLTGSFAISAFGKLLFDANNGFSGNEIWISDGTSAGTKLLYDINPGGASSKCFGFMMYKEKIYFFADYNNVKQLWSTDGTMEGTHVEVDFKSDFGFDDDAHIKSAVLANDRLLFSVYEIGERSELWSSDGTVAGTKLVRRFKIPLSDDSVINLYEAGKRAYFFAADDLHDRGLWSSDGTDETTRFINVTNKDLAVFDPDVHGQFYFTANDMLWRTGGTLTTTDVLLSPNAPSFEVRPTFAKVIDNDLFRALSTPELGMELYVEPFTMIDQNISFDLTDQQVSDVEQTLPANAASELPIVYSGSPADRVSIDGDRIKFLEPGKVTITANQSGNEGIDAADPVSIEICANPAQPDITIQSVQGGLVVLESSAPEGNQWYLSETLIKDGTGQTYEATVEGEYFVWVTAEGCTTEGTNGKVVTITGLEKEAGVSAFPNPAKDKLFVEWIGRSANASIMDLNGNQLINSSFVDKAELSTSALSAGLYILRLSSDDRQVIMKFIKE